MGSHTHDSKLPVAPATFRPSPLMMSMGKKKGSGRQARVSLQWHALLKEVTLNPTWAPKVCKIMAFMAVIMGLGRLFYILLGSR